MPNWTANYISAAGAPPELHAFVEAIRSRHAVFDFDRIVPMPGELKDVDHSIGDFTVGDEPAHRDRTAAENWSRMHWGSKWNSRNSRLDGETSTGRIEIGFSTPSVPPVPLLREMIAMFPNIFFDCRFQLDEDMYTHTYNLNDVKGA